MPGNSGGQGYSLRDEGHRLEGFFTGSVELVSGEIGEDVAQYLLTSEQTPQLSPGCAGRPEGFVAASGGLILQLFPDAGEDVLTRLEQSLNQLPPVSTLVNQGLTPEEIVSRAVGGLEVQYLEKNPVYFKCTCSRDRIKDILAAMGEAEIKNILEERGEAEVRCHFCGDSYTFNASELEDIISGL